MAYDHQYPNSIKRNPKLEIDGLTDQFESNVIKNRDGWYGWKGLGGSVLQWNPELKIGFGYATTDLFPLDIINERIGVL